MDAFIAGNQGYAGPHRFDCCSCRSRCGYGPTCEGAGVETLSSGTAVAEYCGEGTEARELSFTRWSKLACG